MQQRQDIRNYRDELKGIAILWIVLFHTRLNVPSGLFEAIYTHGYAGVDIFFFLTGFGLYHSLSKSQELRGYAIRRAKRLLPAYLPFCAIWLCVMIPYYGLSTVQAARTAVGNLLMISFWTDVPHTVNWYVTALITVIILAPFIYAALAGAKRPLLMQLALIASAFALGIVFISTEQMMMISRLPIFVIGMCFAAKPQGECKRALKITAYALSFAIGAAALWLCETRADSLLNDYGMYWYPFVLMTIPICAALAFAFRKAEKLRRVFAPLRYIGQASFEIFLFNAWIEVYTKNILKLDPSPRYLLWALASIAAGCAYHAIVSLCTRRLNKQER